MNGSVETVHAFECEDFDHSREIIVVLLEQLLILRAVNETHFGEHVDRNMAKDGIEIVVVTDVLEKVVHVQRTDR